jgi:hypothetical protein
MTSLESVVVNIPVNPAQATIVLSSDVTSSIQSRFILSATARVFTSGEAYVFPAVSLDGGTTRIPMQGYGSTFNSGGVSIGYNGTGYRNVSATFTSYSSGTLTFTIEASAAIGVTTVQVVGGYIMHFPVFG